MNQYRDINGYDPTKRRKLHITIPTELWGIVFAKRDMNRIDELVTELLCKHYGVDLNDRNKGR